MTRSTGRCWCIGLALAAVLAGPLRAAPRIVSLNPCSDAILTEVADPAQIVALSAYSHDPATSSLPPAVAARYATTRGTLEAVLMLHPDVVVDGAFVAPATVRAYRALGLRLELFGTQRNLDDARRDIRRLAALAGHADRGEALIRRIDAALIAAAPAHGTAQIDAVLWEWGGMVAGRDTLIGDLLTRTGFANSPARQGYGQADIYPIERLLAAPPRVILTVGDDRMLHHPALRALSNTAHVALPTGLISCGGPTIIPAVAQLARIRRALMGSKS